jgi:hypothetical protein
MLRTYIIKEHLTTDLPKFHRCKMHQRRSLQISVDSRRLAQSADRGPFYQIASTKSLPASSLHWAHVTLACYLANRMLKAKCYQGMTSTFIVHNRQAHATRNYRPRACDDNLLFRPTQKNINTHSRPFGDDSAALVFKHFSVMFQFTATYERLAPRPHHNRFSVTVHGPTFSLSPKPTLEIVGLQLDV